MKVFTRSLRFARELLIILLFILAPSAYAGVININSAYVSEKSILIKGRTTIPYHTSSYIQYYAGKIYEDTITCCILSDGFTVSDNGDFSLEIPLDKLRGQGRYEIEQAQH